MAINSKISILLCVISFHINGLYAQIWIDQESIYEEAEGYLEGKEPEEALSLYKLIEKKGISNSNISYKMGLCYFMQEGLSRQSIPYFESAVANLTKDYSSSIYQTKAPYEALIYLGRAYRADNRFDKAEECLQQMFDAHINEELDLKAKHYLQQVQYARLFTSQPGSARLVDINDNSAYSVYNPIVLSDTQVFYMESRPFYEAVLSGAILDNVLIESENLSPMVGTDEDLILTSASYSGDQLIFVAYVPGKGNELYYSQKVDEKWTTATAFPDPINSPSNENFASLSAACDILYFSSNRPGGVGGSDIYMALPDENKIFDKVQNLGPIVNTPYDEELCYVSPDGNTLFINSEGSINIGESDYFVTTKDDNGNWNVPVNLGIPVSTTDFDNFLSPSPSGDLYLSRYSAEMAGKQGIYRATPTSGADLRKVIVNSQLDFTGQMEPKAVQYSITNTANGELVKQSQTDLQGATTNILTEGTYLYSFVYNDELIARQKVVITPDFSADELNPEPPVWEYMNLKLEITEIVLQDILFEFNSTKLDYRYRPMLDSLLMELQKDQTIQIIIEGYSDVIGKKEYNEILSLKRAQTVKEYFVKNGVADSRISTQGKGPVNPVAINTNDDGSDNPEGRKYNRRVNLQLDTNQAKFVIRRVNIVPTELLVK